MRRRHRRVLFHLFAFSLLGLSIYLNIYRMDDGNIGSPSENPARVKSTVKENGSVPKLAVKNKPSA